MNKKLLLHSCCAPCSSSVIERLKDQFEITILYYNPNIEPLEEYLKRKKEQIKLLNLLNIKYEEIDYLNNEFIKKIKGYELEPEKGYRCNLCFELRLEKTAQLAKEKKYDIFGTTLSVSPHKNSVILNAIGKELSNKYKIEYLIADFKKENGYKRSIELAKEYNLYRQKYCGCRYSKE